MKKIIYLITTVILFLSCYKAQAQLIGEGDTLWCKPLSDIGQIQYSPDGTKLGVLSDRKIILFNSDNGEELLILKSAYGRFEFSHDSKMVYYVNVKTNNINGCDVESGEIKEEYILEKIDGHYWGDVYLTKNPDLIMVSDCAILNKSTKEIVLYYGYNRQIATSKNSDYIIGSYCHTYEPGNIYLFNINNYKSEDLGYVEGVLYTGRKDVSMSSNGKYGASIIQDLIIWDLENKKIFKTYGYNKPTYDSILQWTDMFVSAFTHKSDMIVVMGNYAGNDNGWSESYALFLIDFKNDKRAIIYPKGISSWELDIRNDDKSLAFTGYDDSTETEYLTVVKLKTDAVSDVEEKTKEINTISPNPAADFIYLPESNEMIKDAAIFSMFGEKVMLINNSDNNMIDVSGLSKGVYFLRINNKSYKFVKV